MLGRNFMIYAEYHSFQVLPKVLYSKYGLDYIFQCLVNHTNCYRIDVFNFCHILSYFQSIMKVIYQFFATHMQHNLDF